MPRPTTPMHTSATAPMTIQRIAPVIDSSSVPVMRHRTATSAPEELQIGDEIESSMYRRPT